MRRRRLKVWQHDMEVLRLQSHRDIFDRDEWQCRAIGGAGDGKYYGQGGPRCRARSQLERHHLLNRSQGGTDDQSNLLTVCHHHHVKITQRKPTYYATIGGQILLAWRTKDGEDLLPTNEGRWPTRRRSSEAGRGEGRGL